MSLAAPDAKGPLRRERLRTARLYFCCDARPGGEDPEPLLRAALNGGVDIVQLREKELPRREIERSALTFRRLCDTYSALFVVNDDPDLARACNADGVHVGQDDMPAAEVREIARPRRDHRPLDPLRGADRGGAGRPVDYISVRPDLGDADEGGPPGGRPRPDPPRRRQRPAPLLRDRRHRPVQRGAGGRRRRAAALRGAGDPRRRGPRPPSPKSCATRWRRSGRRRPVADAARASASSAAPPPPRASGWSAATRRRRSATARPARRWSRWPRASGRWW